MEIARIAEIAKDRRDFGPQMNAEKRRSEGVWRKDQQGLDMAELGDLCQPPKSKAKSQAPQAEPEAKGQHLNTKC
jgi:hypothetical protein